MKISTIIGSISAAIIANELGFDISQLQWWVVVLLVNYGFAVAFSGDKK